MKILLIIWHAKSDWSDSSLDDHDRVLNDKGVKAFRLIENWISELDFKVDQVITSSAVRSQSTANRLFTNNK